jgi:flavin-dependent dehydrogenase
VFDVLVIGGGPAGATSALLLARAGRKVALIEKAAFPRRKVCGEYLAPRAASFLRSLGLDLGPEVRRIALWGKHSLSAPLPAPYASTLSREELDAFLLRKAARAGAAIFQPLKAAPLEKTKHGFACGSIEARTVVAADGTPTLDREHLPSDLLAFKAHFRNGAIPADVIALVPFPGGYGGVLRLGDGRATFACCIRRDALEDLREPGISAGESLWQHALGASAELRRAFTAARRDGAWLASGPLRPGLRRPYRDGIYAVGNAAGEVHPIIGQGISLAIHSAALLSVTLGMPHVYERECRRLYSRALWPSSLIVRLTPHARAPWMLTLGARLAAA